MLLPLCSVWNPLSQPCPGSPPRVNDTVLCCALILPYACECEWDCANCILFPFSSWRKHWQNGPRKRLLADGWVHVSHSMKTLASTWIVLQVFILSWTKQNADWYWLIHHNVLVTLYNTVPFAVSLSTQWWTVNLGNQADPQLYRFVSSHTISVKEGLLCNRVRGHHPCVCPLSPKWFIGSKAALKSWSLSIWPKVLTSKPCLKKNQNALFFLCNCLLSTSWLQTNTLSATSISRMICHVETHFNFFADFPPFQFDAIFSTPV